MDLNKNTYVFFFSTAMVLVVAALLSFTSIKLKPLQQKNIALENKQNILSSVGIYVSREEADLNYEKYITDSFVLDSDGQKTDIDISSVELNKETKKPKKEQNMPLYISNIDGSEKYIIPLRGTGLWGPIWGYISLDNDMNTVYGAVFDHKAETPGLGAEINRDFFEKPFNGKRIFDLKGDFVSIAVVKGGAKENDYHGVDGISGGTITSDGVTAMLKERLDKYLPYFENKMKENEVNDIMNFIEEHINLNDTINKLN